MAGARLFGDDRNTNLARRVQLKTKIVLILAIAVLIAAFGAKAGWKWHGVGKANAPYKIAGWSWGDGAVQGARD
jgi:hypothetical protein